jgi:phosphoribosylglycinamide formyltransferase-1
MKKLVLFASGSGTNAENIIRYFNQGTLARVVMVFSNRATAAVVDKAKSHNIAVTIFDKDELYNGGVFEKLRQFEPDLVVLAGFLLKFPAEITAHYPNKIINIHPALLPKYGGKGMYGINVHNAILANNEIETGISIHFVNEHYDDGNIIFQKAVPIDDCTTAEEIAVKVHELEHQYFPLAIEKLLQS